MASATKLLSITVREAKRESPLTPEMREFIDRAVVPILVKQYLDEPEAKNVLANQACAAPHSAEKGVA